MWKASYNQVADVNEACSIIKYKVKDALNSLFHAWRETCWSQRQRRSFVAHVQKNVTESELDVSDFVLMWNKTIS